MVGAIGFEPMTSTMSTWRANQLRHAPAYARLVWLIKAVVSEDKLLNQFGAYHPQLLPAGLPVSGYT